MPNNDMDIYHNRRIVTPGGRAFTQAINSNPTSEIPRTYLFDATDFAALSEAFNDSNGDLYPMVLVESTDKKLVYFDGYSFSQRETAYQLYEPSINLVEVPYIPDGETF